MDPAPLQAVVAVPRIVDGRHCLDPARWTREIAAEFVAAVDRMQVGEWTVDYRCAPERLGKPLTAGAKNQYLVHVRRFFQDCQEWEWIPRHFDPRRSLATPRAIRACLLTNPRVISDDVWGKLLWAGLNLTLDDRFARWAPTR